jgi:hypothetical protein
MEQKVQGRKTKMRDTCRIIAERIEKTNCKGEILFNTLRDFYRESFNEGYFQNIKEAAKLRRKREQGRKADWNEEKTRLDDLIHGYKANINESKA